MARLARGLFLVLALAASQAHRRIFSRPPRRKHQQMSDAITVPSQRFKSNSSDAVTPELRSSAMEGSGVQFHYPFAVLTLQLGTWKLTRTPQEQWNDYATVHAVVDSEIELTAATWVGQTPKVASTVKALGLVTNPEANKQLALEVGEGTFRVEDQFRAFWCVWTSDTSIQLETDIKLDPWFYSEQTLGEALESGFGDLRPLFSAPSVIRFSHEIKEKGRLSMVEYREIAQPPVIRKNKLVSKVLGHVLSKPNGFWRGYGCCNGPPGLNGIYSFGFSTSVSACFEMWIRNKVHGQWLSGGRLLDDKHTEIIEMAVRVHGLPELAGARRCIPEDRWSKAMEGIDEIMSDEIIDDTAKLVASFGRVTETLASAAFIKMR